MKKLLALFFIIILLFASVGTVNVFAQNEEVIKQAKESILCDYNTGYVISKHNEKERLPIASMCKIMTLLLIFDEVESGNLSLDDNIFVSENASGMGGSQAFIEANSEYKASELIKSIVIASANDSCVAFAEKISGCEKDFVVKMNDKAKELGMSNTLFSNCTGLPKPTQYSCAEDVAKMFTKLISHKEYFTFSKIWMDEIKHKEGRVTGLTNTNKMIRFYEGCDGGKTGYTSEAGHCLACTAKRGNMRLISVVISACDSKARFKETTEMFNYGFANYTNKMLVDSSKPISVKARVQNGKEDCVEVIPEIDYFVFGKKDEKCDYRMEFVPNEKNKAPIKKGDCVGTLTVYCNGKNMTTINCLANSNVDKKVYFDYLSSVVENWAI